jgi:iron complex outermembrane receptor protein
MNALTGPARIAGLVVLCGLATHAANAYADINAAADESVQLEEIVVTSEKRSESIQAAPAAITAISGEELSTLGLDNISQMSGLFPSARFEPTGFSSHLYVRGIGAEQDRIAVDQLVNMSMDGVLLPREMSSVALFDIHDIELLPGPQGTLYGASSVGGVLTIQNNQPTAKDENNLLLEAGNFAEFRVDDVQNFSVNDVLSVRGAVDYTRHSAYETSGGWTGDALTGRLGLLFKPSEQFSAYIWGLVVNDDSLPADLGTVNPNGGFLPANGTPWDIAHSCITQACNGFSNVQVSAQNIGMTRDYIVAGQFDWHLDGFTVTDIPAVLHNQTYQTFNAYVFPNTYAVDNHQLSNELKATSDSKSALQWIAGLYLYQNKADQFFNAGTYNLPQFTLENVAPYGQMTYAFTDQLRATAGLRYSWTSKDGTFVLPNPLPETSATWSSVDWKAGIEYDLNASTLTYLTAQTGSSPGTLDAQNPVDGRPGITDLTKLYSLTGGWKSRLLDNRLQFNNEVFYYDYKDFLIQTIVCANPTCATLGNVYLNAPKLISWGDQLDLRWLITAADQVSVGAAFTSTKTGTWVTNAGANLSNQTLFEAPEMTTTVSAQHAFSMPAGGSTILRVDSYLVSGYYADFETNPGGPVHISYEYQPSFTNTGVSLIYHAPRDKWTFGLWSLNLEDKGQLGPGGAFPYPTPVGAPFSKVGGVAAIVNTPRTFGVRFTANFL